MAIAIKKYLHDLDLVNHRIVNVRLHPITTAERIALGATLTEDEKGIVVFDVNSNAPFYWSGFEWVSGVVVTAETKVDYVYDLTGDVDGINDTFMTTSAFGTGTARVWLNGLNLTPGLGYDYTEFGNVGIKFNSPPDIDSNITIKYTKL